jgi:DNA (cytosine-5)-methyltransferase 1
VRYLSVCSGIEAASVAWHDLGWQCVGVSEIEPFACAVLAHHYPTVRNYGDMTRYREWEIADGTVDLLVGGTPCQSFSVAGLRRGLDDPRGNLALVFLGMVDRFRPRWVVWENVPGVLSSNGGRDFGAFLGGLAQLGYGLAYRVLDAQYARVDGYERAVPQRRRRVFVVGCAGGDARRAAQVLLERQGVRGNFATRGEARETTTGRATRGSASGGEVSGTVSAKWSKGTGGPAGDEVQNLVAEWPPQVADPITAHEQSTYTHEGKTFRVPNVVPTSTAVRRLTPRECERLQGFPDDYTLIEYRKKPAADGPRYRALGNSMAVNVMRWIGLRIASVEGQR